MQIVSGRVARARFLARAAIELSQKARQRLRWFEYYQAHGRNAARICRYFGISRQTFYLYGLLPVLQEES